MLQIKTFPQGAVNIDRNEVYRYLGCKSNLSVTDENIKKLIEDISSETEQLLNCKVCYDKYPLYFKDNGEIDLGFITVKSDNLRKNLKNCSHIYVFTATVGIGADRLIQRYTNTSPSKAVIVQAAGASAIEGLCDLFCNDLKIAEAETGNHLRPRFSPGYGDFPIEIQRNIFSVLDCSRKIGVTLTDNYLMIPTKSVSAIIGVSKINSVCIQSGCEACNNLNCEFRRN